MDEGRQRGPLPSAAAGDRRSGGPVAVARLASPGRGAVGRATQAALSAGRPEEHEGSAAVPERRAVLATGRLHRASQRLRPDARQDARPHRMPRRRRGERGGPSRVAPPARRGTAGQCGGARAGLPASRGLPHLRVGGGPARAARARRGSRAVRRRAERRGLRAVQARRRVGRRAEGVARREKRPARGLLRFGRHGPRHGHAAPRHRAARRARARQPVPLRRAGRDAGGGAPAARPAPRRPRAT